MSMRQKVRNRIAKPVLIVAALCLSAQMFGTVSDVLLRLTVHKSILGMYESMEAFMMYATFMALVYAYGTGRGIIRVDLFFDRLPPGTQKMANALVLILSWILFAFLFYSASVATYQDFVTGDFRHGIVQFPLWPIKLSETIGALLMVILISMDIIEARITPRSSGVEEKAAVDSI
jgi:TRAP-type C4-dicarboxylate transport system permease small subunit